MQKISITDFSNLIEIGKGAFGTVYKATYKKNNRIFALKRMQISHLQRQNMISQINTEISISTKLKHQNIIKVYDCFQDQEYIYLVLELAENGQLYEKLKKQGRFNENTVKAMIKDVIAAVQYLHSQNPPIIHRDIKPENLLLDKRNKVKLADFGWSTVLNKPRRTYCGTIDYLAPEMIDKSGHDEKLDIWCIGVLVYELLTGRTPFLGETNQNNTPQVVQRNILNMKIEFPASFPTLAKDFVMGMIKRNPKDRMTYSQIKNHPWLTQQVESPIIVPPPIQTEPEPEQKQKPEPKTDSKIIQNLNMRIKQLEEQNFCLKKNVPIDSSTGDLEKLMKQNRSLKLAAEMSKKYEESSKQYRDKYDRKEIQMKITTRKNEDLTSEVQKLESQKQQLEQKVKKLQKEIQNEKEKYSKVQRQLDQANSGFIQRAKNGRRITKQELENPEFVTFLRDQIDEFNQKFEQSKSIVSKMFEKQSKQKKDAEQLSRLRAQQKKMKESIRMQIRQQYENEKDNIAEKFRKEFSEEKQKWFKERQELRLLYEEGNYEGSDPSKGQNSKEHDLEGELKNLRELQTYYEKTISEMRLESEDLKQQIKRMK